MKVYCRKYQFKFFFQQEAGGFGNNIAKKPQKPRPELKIVYIIYSLRIFALPTVQWKW